MHLFDELTKTYKLINTDKKDIYIYVCGPTVYDDCHLGHGRSLIVFDLLYRILKYSLPNNNILFFQNITDIDDKIVNKAIQQNTTPSEIAIKYTNKYLNLRKILNIDNITYMPKVTQNLHHIYDYIQCLIDNNKAYVVNNSVYFDMKQCENYTNVFNTQNFENSEIITEKRYWKDFALWKKFDNYGYDSPWGYGRPGWHIECSAMIYAFCGKFVDIHGGGCDLSFPHHTNEILQCKARFNTELSNIWIHNGMICINSIKMSKSLLNSKYLHEIVYDNYTSDLFRWWILQYSYNSTIDFDDITWKNTQKSFDRMRQYYFKNIYNKNISINTYDIEFDFTKIIQEIHVCMNNNDINKMYTYLHVCGFYMTPNSSLSEFIINDYIQQRLIEKQAKNFKKADEIREYLIKNHILLIDNGLTTNWYYI